MSVYYEKFRLDLLFSFMLPKS